MTEWIISSSILILVVAAVRTVFKGRIKLTLQYAMWLLVLVRLLVPFSFGSTNISVSNLTEAALELPAVQAVTDIGNLNIPVQSYEDAYDHVVQQYESEGVKIEDLQGSELEALEYEAYELMRGRDLSEIFSGIAYIVWAAGIVTVGSIFLYTNLRFRAKIRRSRQDLGITKNGLAVYATDEIDTPCLFGLRHPAIYITCDAADDPKRLRHTIEHEVTHYHHGDHIWPFLRCLCLAIHWYNLLVWWAAYLSQRDAELACDEMTIKRLGEEERAEYGRTLIGMTCRKRGNLLITATTMNAGKRGIKERVLLIAKKPKMAVYTLAAVLLIVAVAVGCTFTGARPGDETTPDDPDNPVLETEYDGPTVLPTDPPDLIPVFPEITGLYDEAVDDKVCIAVWPVTEEYLGEGYKFIIPENQEEFVAAFEKAMESVGEENAWDPETGSCGWWLVYQGKWWTGMKDGSLAGWMDGVNAEAAADMHALCEAAVREAGIAEPVRPEEIKGICSATLYWNGVHTVNDEYALGKIESWLSNSSEINSTACLFTAILTLELENGEMKNILMATDGCASWLSEGVFYHFNIYDEDGLVKNDVFYELFAHELIREEASKGMEELPSHLYLLNWSRYTYFYGSKETFALMDKIRSYILEDPDQRCGWAIGLTDGLDGVYADYYAGILAEAFEANKSEFAWQCLGNATDRDEEAVLYLLSYHWGVSVEEARRILEMEIGS